MHLAWLARIVFALPLVTLAARPDALAGAAAPSPGATHGGGGVDKPSVVKFPAKHFKFECEHQGCDGTGTEYFDRLIHESTPRRDRAKQRYRCERIGDCKECAGSGVESDTRIHSQLLKTAQTISADKGSPTHALRQSLVDALHWSVAARDSECLAESNRHPGALARHKVLADRIEELALTKFEAAKVGSAVYLVLKTPGSASKWPNYADDDGTIVVTGSPYGDLALVSPFGLELDRGLRYLVFATKGAAVDRSGKTCTELKRVIAVPFPKM